MRQAYAEQLQELYLDGAAAAGVVVLAGEGADFGRLLAEAVAASSWSDVPGPLLDISQPLAKAVLQQLRSADGYEQLAAALAAEPERCSGLGSPFAAQGLRPRSLPSLIILKQRYGTFIPAGTLHLVAALASLCGQPLPPSSQLPRAWSGITGDELRRRSDERHGCRPCQLALNVQLFARGEPLLPKGGRCSGACAAAGLAQLPESRRKRMYEMIDCGRFWQPSRLLRLSGSPATLAWVDAAHAARFEPSDAAEAAADDGWEPLPAEQLHTGEAAEIHGWGSAWVQLADPEACWAAWERAAAAVAERERQRREREAAKAAKSAAQAAQAAEREPQRREREERAVAQLWEVAANAAAKAAERERERAATSEVPVGVAQTIKQHMLSYWGLA